MPAGSERQKLATVAVIWALGRALAVLGVAALAGCGRDVSTEAEGKDSLRALAAPVESRRYDLEFWAHEERGRTRIWRAAAGFCGGRSEATFPNCRSVRMAAWWGTTPPLPALPQITAMPGAPPGEGNAQKAAGGPGVGGGQGTAARGGPGRGSSGTAGSGRQP